MKRDVKIVGLVQAKNEWPLLALSISHALLNHVDEVYVLNHASTDGSVEGLRSLQKLWKTRIHILHCNDEHFWQEASTNALIGVSQRSSPDWVYVFDADEFLLTGNSKSLKDVLNHIDPQCSVVRYEVQNWISTKDFDESNLDHYRMLCYRSVANLFLDLYPEVYADEIWNGNLNFYDIPFPSKVIFKSNRIFWLGAGAHNVKADSNVQTLSLAADEIRVAHFPLLTRERVDLKAIQGQQLIKDGFPPTHGWQNQMIYRFSKEKIGSQFWESHTVAHRNDWDRTLPSYVLDNGFVQAIEPTLRLLEDELGSTTHKTLPASGLSVQRPDETLIPFATVVQLTRNFQLVTDSILAERVAAINRLDVLLNSNSWRCTAPIRLVVRWLRHALAIRDRQHLIQILSNQYSRLPLPNCVKRLVSFAYFRIFRKIVLGSIRSGVKRFKAPSIKPGAQNEGRPDYFIWGIIDWHFRHQRPQQLALVLAATNRRVFYISPTFVDAAHPGFEVEALDTEKKIFQIKLFARKAPSIYFNAPDPKNIDQLRLSVGEVLDWANSEQIVSLVDHPFWHKIASVLPNSRLVYDCMDHHEGFGNNSESLTRLEKELLSKAELAIATSSLLEDFIAAHAKRRALIRNACDYEHFSNPPNPVYRDPEGRRIIGYYGAIAEWFDLDLVKRVARQHPDCSVLLIGKDTINAKSKLSKLSNVTFTGEVPYSKLPYYLHGFDVCLLPFKVIPLTLATNPVKIYEYLSAGKPVVSVNLPEMTQFNGLVSVAGDSTAFLAALQSFLSQPEIEASRYKRKVFAMGQTWQHRAEELILHAETDEYDPKVSVVVVTYNNLSFTRSCLESLDKHSQYKEMEIIAVDNGSNDDTPAFLSQWVKNSTKRKLILNDENRGFAAANNQGLKIATGDYLVLLNNDTYVTPGWIRTMIRHLEGDKTIGLIGPVTNNIGNEAKLDITYNEMDSMLVKAAAYTRRHIGQSFPLRTAAFFCAMMPRTTYERVGSLDESFGQGFFEDDDYCRRIEAYGLRIACAEDVFIHHHLSASFNNVKRQERQKLFDENRKIYEAKWGAWTPHSYGSGKSRSVDSQFPAIPNFFNEHKFILGQCVVCGNTSRFFYEDARLLRESLVCQHCRSTSRYRSIAYGLLRAITELTGVDASSLAALPNCSRSRLHVYDTQPPFYYQPCAYPLPDLLKAAGWIDVTLSQYKPDRKMGETLAKNITNQNLESLTFPDGSFDIVITSDVMEHVRLDERAHGEIYRVLKPGGVYVFTVPHRRAWDKTLIRVQVVDPDDPSKDVHLLEPEYHGDANNEKQDGALAYRTYGRDLETQLMELGFEVEYSHEDIEHQAILNTELFYCKKVPVGDKSNLQ